MKRLLLLAVLVAGLVGPAWGQATQPADVPGTGSVIFIHPDGTSAATWAVTRNLHYGPDGQLHWDRLPAMALYRGHMLDRLTATSNGGATTHAYGVKVHADAFGDMGGTDHTPIVDADGNSLSVAHQAIRVGLPVGLVQTGTSTEPGTAAFVTSVPERSMHDEIARQLVESGVRVILGGGEQFFLPEGEQGVHGPGKRKDDLNLIELAKQKGYAVVRTRDELLNLSEGTDRVLGLFAADHIFNDMPEELLDVAGKPHYKADAPTVAEMTQAALDVLSAGGSRFLLVVEEEGTDNFGNVNNASGMIQAMKRADDAIGVARTFVAENPRTLILTAADSDGGGMRMIGLRPPAEGQEYPKTLPRWDYNGAPIHGVDGQGTKPYMAAPDRNGRQWPFAIVWATRSDVTGGVLVKGEGLNSHLIRGNMDNTELTQLMRLTLFGGTTPE